MSFALCTQYKFNGSPTIAVAVDDHVVGAAGAEPIVNETISLHSESPLLFVAATLKNHSLPVSSPITCALLVVTDNELVCDDVSK